MSNKIEYILEILGFKINRYDIVGIGDNALDALKCASYINGSSKKKRVDKVILIFPKFLNTFENKNIDIKNILQKNNIDLQFITKKFKLFVILGEHSDMNISLDSICISNFFSKYGICFIVKQHIIDKISNLT